MTRWSFSTNVEGTMGVSAHTGHRCYLYVVPGSILHPVVLCWIVSGPPLHSRHLRPSSGRPSPLQVSITAGLGLFLKHGDKRVSIIRKVPHNRNFLGPNISKHSATLMFKCDLLFSLNTSMSGHANTKCRGKEWVGPSLLPFQPLGPTNRSPPNWSCAQSLILCRHRWCLSEIFQISLLDLLISATSVVHVTLGPLQPRFLNPLFFFSRFLLPEMFT